MTDDPVRLLEGGGSDLLRTLISAAREEEPKPAALQRTLMAVGVGAALTTAAASASGASATGAGSTGVASGAALGTVNGAASTALVVVKWLALGAITGTVASSAAYRVSSALSPEPALSVSAAAVNRDPEVAPQSPPRASTALEIAPETPPPPAVVVVPPSVPEPPALPSKAAPGAPLAAEVAALDGARQALGAGDAARTLDLLSGYETRFPEGRMLAEALDIRLEAFTLKGDKADAEAVARRILHVFPSSPHAARARAVLGVEK